MHQRTVKTQGYNFKRIKRLYGILKAIKTTGGGFEITNENGRFRLTTCSFLILLSMCGLNDVYTIRIWGYNPVILNEFVKEIKKG